MERINQCRKGVAAHWVFGLIAGCLLLGVSRSHAAGDAAGSLEFFETRIRPVLVAECYECHAGDKAKGGLRLDYRDAMRKGGKTGPAIIPGEAGRSLLVQSIRHALPELKMPKDGARLEERIVGDFEAWINAGAPDPRLEPPVQTASVSWADTVALRRQWWSLRPVARPVVPEPSTARADWSQPIDRFLLKEMEAHDLAPGADADPATFIRRIHFALTGLPPKPEALKSFLQSWRTEGRSNAVARLTDQLLASPAFGERWARHWMDLMRYAETHGSEGDPEIRSAWRYRDYLIRAFNADVPGDQLIREHLAGDLLPAKEVRWNRAEGLNESVIGLASLRLNEHGFQPVDTLAEQVRVVENQIDVVGKAFQGLTIACARCHDHKFDAVSQADYYALYGVLASTRPAQVAIDSPDLLNRHRAELAGLKGRIKSELAAAWAQAVPELTAQLARGSSRDPETVARLEQITALEKQLATLEATARARVLATRSSGDTSLSLVRLPQPVARWSFEEDARDQVGTWHGELVGGARLQNGRLILDGREAHLRTGPLARNLRAKTLEAWVALTTLKQGGGGVLTVENGTGAEFDAIVFAEKETARWVNGSDNFHRSQNLGGPAETSGSNVLVHVAVVYGADNRVTFYRNGAPYGVAFTPAGPNASLRIFKAGDARVLLGRRHTGGGNAFLAGEIDEARIYDQALSPEEVAASFGAGPAGFSRAMLVQAMSPEERAQHAAAVERLDALRAATHKTVGDREDRVALALQAAMGDPMHPLHALARLRGLEGAAFVRRLEELRKQGREQLMAARRHNAQFIWKWDLTRPGDVALWSRYGTGLTGANSMERSGMAGDFSIEPEVDRVMKGLLPAGVFSHGLSQKHGGLLTSPRFKVETDSISVRVAGRNGATVRLIVDNYPLGVNSVFPRVELERDESGWVRMDTAYRKGSWAYLEVATSDLLTRRARGAEVQPRSWFGIQSVAFHDAKEPPREESQTVTWLLAEPSPVNAPELIERYAARLREAIAAWRTDVLTEPQRSFLQAFIGRELLPVQLPLTPNLASLVAEYRNLEAAIPTGRYAPGVLEGDAHDVALMLRGDPQKPGAPVPRGYLGVLGAGAFFGTNSPAHSSGRLELARAMTQPDNPLTARVLANRLWQHLFGQGLVATVDNFGRLGEQPTHPALLDYLATRLMEEGWSIKRLLREIVSTRAYGLASEPSSAARELDPRNQWLSHFPTRRLEAEAIRDAMLSVAGLLVTTQFGPPVANNAVPRRSIYLPVRRNQLNPFLETFDAPKPFTTLGQRDATNVPAQSLALLNDPFVIETARQWADALIRKAPRSDAADRIREMFLTAFGRRPEAAELQASLQYLTTLQGEGESREADLAGNRQVWQNYAQSLFNLKEFIYLR